MWVGVKGGFLPPVQSYISCTVAQKCIAIIFLLGHSLHSPGKKKDCGHETFCSPFININAPRNKKAAPAGEEVGPRGRARARARRRSHTVSAWPNKQIAVYTWRCHLEYIIDREAGGEGGGRGGPGQKLAATRGQNTLEAHNCHTHSYTHTHARHMNTHTNTHRRTDLQDWSFPGYKSMQNVT